ncbi:hypothetical protein F5H01DRAFT_331155 [Linnemannia elongata]|nr:hypothetical protein F5H01DRAFT_331155 [Linnemannia elongata]
MLFLLSTSALLRHLCLQPPSLFLLCLPVPRSASAASAQDVGHIYACTIAYCSIARPPIVSLCVREIYTAIVRILYEITS